MACQVARTVFEFFQQAFDILQCFVNVLGRHLVLVEVLVETAGYLEISIDVAVAGLGSQMARDLVQVTMPTVLPAARFGNGLHHLGHGSPTLLGCLLQIALGQFGPALGHHGPAAGSVVRSGGHAARPCSFSC